MTEISTAAQVNYYVEADVVNNRPVYHVMTVQYNNGHVIVNCYDRDYIIRAEALDACALYAQNLEGDEIRYVAMLLPNYAGWVIIDISNDATMKTWAADEANRQMVILTARKMSAGLIAGF